jgi:hypothetical protein
MSTTTLTESKVRTFEQNVAIIRKGLATFVEMGLALKQIRDLKQYAKAYGTGKGWDSFLKKEFGMTTQYAGQLIAAGEIASRLKSETIVSVLPTSESQVRPLKKAPEALQPKIWNDAVNGAKKKGKAQPTAKDVVKARDENLAKDPGTSKTDKEAAKARLAEEEARPTKDATRAPLTLDNLKSEVKADIGMICNKYKGSFSRLAVLNCYSAIVNLMVKEAQKAIETANTAKANGKN